MKFVLCLAVLATALINVNAVKSSPKVQVYSRNPGTYGKSNRLICFVSGFHPPDIHVELLKNGEEIPGASQTDLAFEESWQFRITRSVDFTPMEGSTYTCRVTHSVDSAKDYQWEADM